MVEVRTTTAGYSFEVTPNGLVRGTSIGIRDYTERFRHFQFNPVTRRREVKSWYRLYDRDSGRVYLPRYDLNNFLHWLSMNGLQATIVDCPGTVGDPVKFHWSGKFEFRNETQREVITGLERLKSGIYPIAAQTGVGKALTVSTRLKTPSGWMSMGQACVGDILTGWDGRPTRITGVFPQGILPGWKMIFEDGRSEVVSGDHLWRVFLDDDRLGPQELGQVFPSVVKSTDYIRSALFRKIACYIPLITPTDYDALLLSNEEIADYAQKVALPDTPLLFGQGTISQRKWYLDNLPETLPRDHKEALLDHAWGLGYICLTRDSSAKTSFSRILLTNRMGLRVTQIVADKSHVMQCISVDHPDKLFVCGSYIVTHNTVSLIRSSETKSIRTMVTMRTRIDQWESEFFKFTDALEKQLYIIKGRSSLERLMMHREDGTMPDFIVASIQTLRKYVTRDPEYAFLPRPELFTDYFQIGMIGMDEFHEHLESNYLMMIGLNPAIWVPITATFNKKDEFLNEIVRGFAPSNKRIGEDTYHSFVDIFGYECNMGHGVITRECYMGPRGYSGTKLEKFFTKKGKNFFKEFFKEYFAPLFEAHYLVKRVEGDRVFILFQLVEMCYWFQKLMTIAFPDIKSAVYVSGVSRSVLTEYELIITTPGSGGTGTDAPNVRTVFSFVATAQETPLTQHLGRIRYDKHYTRQCEFVYIYFSRVMSHVDYEETRVPLYKEKGISFTKRSYPP